MHKPAIAFLAIGILVTVPPRTLAAEDEAQAVIAKAIKAYGGKEKLDKYQASYTKTKGKMEVMGVELAFSEEIAARLSGEVKQTMDVEFMGKNIKSIAGYDGKKGWAVANGMTIDLPENALAEFKDAGYLMKIDQLTPLTDKKQFELSSLGEVQVNNRPVVGVRVSSKGHSDISLYFDKEKGLLAKMERRKKDMSGKEVTEERFVSEHKEIDGLMVPIKMVVHIDGKKQLEAEVTEVKFVDKIDDSEFAKP
jgi:hypothetical protein